MNKSRLNSSLITSSFILVAIINGACVQKINFKDKKIIFEILNNLKINIYAQRSDEFEGGILMNVTSNQRTLRYGQTILKVFP